ncbi:MAG: hypothetical protein LBS60_13550 [Deltaproteobacteria bacterium]|jgi:hypothetical protein|nr:hypothetical protein [Deltaproteobacteria bacterium]
MNGNWLKAVGLVALVLVAFFVVTRVAAFLGRQPKRVPPTSSYSVSSLGLALIIEVLEREERSTKRVSSRASKPTSDRQLVVLPTPTLSLSFNHQLKKAPNLLIILPKYTYQMDMAKPAWLESGVPIPFLRLDNFAKRLELPLTGEAVLTAPPKRWIQNIEGPAPTIVGQAQLINSPELTPLIASDQGVLLGALTVENRKVYILADPDLLNNHGLVKGDNLTLAENIFAALTPANGEIIFDEPNSPYREDSPNVGSGLFAFPTLTSVLIFLEVILTGFLAYLAGSSRLGPPLKDEEEVNFGRKRLIESGARLLARSGRHISVTRDYIGLTIKAAAKAAHLPKGLNDQEMANALNQKDPKFSVRRLLAEINRTDGPSEKTCLKWAQEIYSFKVRLERGTTASRRNN